MTKVQFSKAKIPSQKNFGITFFFIFLLIYIYFFNNKFSYVFLILSLFFLICAFFFQNFLKPLNTIWFKFGNLLGHIISPIIMGFIYFLVLTPIALILKIFGIDVTNQKKNDKRTYWIIKKNKINNLKKQF